MTEVREDEIVWNCQVLALIHPSRIQRAFILISVG
jgi:hypothetical protein